jgi:hypothetical protein
MKRFTVSITIAAALAFAPAALAQDPADPCPSPNSGDEVQDAIDVLTCLQNLPPIEQHEPTPAEEHEQCVELFGEADCAEFECEESFGPDGCPDSGFVTGPPPFLGIREARGSLRRLFVADLRGLWLHTRITRCHCHGSRRDRVDCTLILRVRGSRCVSPAHVVETREERTATVRGFKCRPTRRHRHR